MKKDGEIIICKFCGKVDIDTDTHECDFNKMRDEENRSDDY